MVSITPSSPDNQAIRDLRDATLRLVTSNDRANSRMLCLTIVMVVLTIAILVLTSVLAWVAYHPIH